MAMTRASALVLGTVLILTAVIGAPLLQRTLQPVPPLPVLDTLGGDFTLPGSRGKDVALHDLRGQLVLLNFGFASCPDVCPTVLTRMRHLLEALGDSAAAIQPLFITIDPARDSLDPLGRYVTHFHPRLIALRGDEVQTRAVAALFKVHYEKQVLEPPLDYVFMHSDHIYLLDRVGRVRATWGSNVTTAAMVDDVRRLLAEPSAPSREQGP